MSDNAEDDVIVVGAGPSGLVAALLLARDGFKTACVTGLDGALPADPRTVALMQPALRLFEHLDLWPGALKEETEALRYLRIIDDSGGALAGDPVTFSAHELGLEAFGHNVPLGKLVPMLLDRAGTAGVTLINARAQRYTRTGETARISLDDGETRRARVIIAADGASSRMRRSAGIGTTDWTYDQTAMVTTFDHTTPHQGVSLEFHKHGGPFTTVPMPGNRSSLVWMTAPDEAGQIMALDTASLCKRLQLEMAGELGLITDAGPLKSFPMRGLTAQKFAANRLYLIGEAAHLMPPIGAQGLNLSLRDAALACEIIGQALGKDEDPGADGPLSDYDRRRRRDIMPRQSLVHILNTSLLSSLPGIDAARVVGLDAISLIPPLKQWVMKQGLASGGDLPEVMRG